MPIILSKGDLRLAVERPGERYKGTRFDRNGTVVSARFRGVEFLADERPAFLRNRARYGHGLHNEFGIKTCVGFDDCAIGDWFPKIGVGWLRKTAKPYSFFGVYETEPIAFDGPEQTGDSVTFRCRSGVRNGWGYEYSKGVTIEGDGFTVRYTLENTGDKTVSTEEYCHNFLRIGGARLGPRYRLSIPWSPDRSRFDEFVDPEGILSLSGGDLCFSAPVRKVFFLGGMSEGIRASEGLAATWTLSEEKRGLSVSETGSFLPSLVNLWGHGGVISPEIFYAFTVEPGNILSWERRYDFAASR